MREWVWACGITFALGILLVGTTTSSAAEDTVKPPSWFTAGPSLVDPASPEEVEAAIQRLSVPIDQEQMNKILFGLARVEDAKERDRLQKMLDEQMQELIKFPAPSTAPSVNQTSHQQVRPNPRIVATADEPSHGELLVRIDTLNLGPNAAVDDLRARDQLVSQIAGIRDPIMRDELLTRLEEKERQLAEGTERP